MFSYSLCLGFKLLENIYPVDISKQSYFFDSIFSFGITIFTEDSLPCTEDIPTCGDTCGKMLDCGIHTCPERCHTGSCGKVRIVGYIPVQRDVKLDLVAR